MKPSKSAAGSGSPPPPLPKTQVLVATALPKALRSDGAEARSRLLNSALNLFAKNGFSKTSTREIATAAGVNIASISYYFGDKAGLYHAVFTEPLGCPSDDIPLYDQPHFSLRESLDGFFKSFLEPLKQGELVQQCMRLHYREMLEPTGLWAKELEHGIMPAHMALANTLQRHMGLNALDDELHRLTYAVTALALHLFICDEVIVALTPQLRNSPEAVDQSAQRLADFAQAMVIGDIARRASLKAATV